MTVTWHSRFEHRIRNSYKLRRIRSMGARLVELRIRPLVLRLRVRHVHGARTIAYGRDELLVLCVVRNGALHVKSFLEHHLALGAAHVVLLDNGSTDATIDLARTYDRVTILHTACPYRTYETILKRYLVDRFSKDRWNLFADIDERFDYPYSDLIDVREEVPSIFGEPIDEVALQDRFVRSIRARGAKNGDAIIGSCQVDRGVRRPIVEQDDMGGPKGEMVLKERLDVQGAVPHHAQHKELVPTIGNLPGAVYVPDSQAENQRSNAELDEAGAHRADAPELIGVADPVFEATMPRYGHGLDRRGLSRSWKIHGVTENMALRVVPHVRLLCA